MHFPIKKKIFERLIPSLVIRVPYKNILFSETNHSLKDNSHGQTHLDELNLLGFKLGVWIAYLLTPIATVIIMALGLDPLYYIVQYMLHVSPRLP